MQKAWRKGRSARRSESALGTTQRSNYAAGKDAEIKATKEECALDMEQRRNYAALKAAQSKLRKEECA